MRRFCNYFVTLFNQKKLNPFTQFIEHETLTQLKDKVKRSMEQQNENSQQNPSPRHSTVFEEPKTLVVLNTAMQFPLSVKARET